MLAKHLSYLNRKLVDVAAGRVKRLLISMPPRPQPFYAKVLMANGTYRDISSLEEGDMVITAKGRPRKVLEVIYAGDQDCYEIKTLCGREIHAAGSHNFLEETRGWTRTDELLPKDTLLALKGYDIEDPITLSPDKAFLLGFLLRTGGSERAQLIIKGVKLSHTHIKQYFDQYGIGYSCEDKTVTLSKTYLKWLEELNYDDKNKVPPIIYRLCKESLRHFIKGSFYTHFNGLEGNKSVIISFTRKEKGIAVLHALARLGVIGILRPTRANFQLEVAKNSELQILNKYLGKSIDDTYEDIPKYYTEAYLKDSVVSIIPTGVFPCYCLKVEEDHTYVTEGIITHNSGKCLEKGTEVYLSNGAIRKIEDIKVGHEVLSVDENGELVPDIVQKVENTGTKDLYEITLGNGLKISASEDHKFMTYGGNWKTLKQLTTSDYLNVPRLPFGNIQLCVDTVFLIALWLAKGVNLLSLKFYKVSDISAKSLARLTELCRIKDWDKVDTNKGAVYIEGTASALPYIKKFKLHEHWHLPHIFLQCDEETVKLFLHIIATEIGSCNEKSILIRCQTYDFAEKLLLLYAKFGIHAVIKQTDNGLYLVIQDTDLFYSIWPDLNKSTTPLKTANSKTNSIYVKIQSIEKKEPNETYDVQITNNPNFIANGIVTHNSELVSKYFPAWYLGNYPDRRIIFATYETRFASEWGATVRDLIAEYGPEVFGIEVKSGSASATTWKIEGRLGGMQAAGAGGPITGKGADCLIIDDPIKNALVSTTPILTPNGFIQLGNIKVGDIIYDQAGKETTVLEVSPIKKVKGYRVTFSDDSYIDADPEHLWTVFDSVSHDFYTEKYKGYNENWWEWRSSKKSCTKTLTTEDLKQSVRVKNNRINWIIPTTLPIEFKEQTLEIDPYLFGLWLGDEGNNTTYITSSENDALFYCEYLNSIGIYTKIKKASASQCINTHLVKMASKKSSIRRRLRRTLVEGEKAIPTKYLKSSVSQRMSLLRGLLDSSGVITDTDAVFCSKNKRLIDSIYFILVSLGSKAVITERKSYWVISFAPTFCPFSLPRKVDKWEKVTRVSIRRLNRTIISITPLKEEADYLCIKVSSPSKLYLAGNSLIPTHNSDEANSIIHREKLWQWFGTTSYTRLQPNGSIIIVATRWTTDDLIGRLISNMEKGVGEEWDVIKFPAIATEDEPEFPAGLGRKKGDALWPEQWPLEKLAAIRDSGALSPYWWSSLYQQSPTPEGGGIFKEQWFRYYTKHGDFYLLEGKAGEDSGTTIFIDDKKCWKFITVDTANKVKDTSDYTAIAVWAVTPDNDLLLVDLIRERIGYEVILKHLIDLHSFYRTRYVGIENMGIAIQLIIEARQKGLPVRELEPEGRGKLNRANMPLGAVVRMESGKVFWPKHFNLRTDIELELLSFPKGAHDEIVDILSYACNELTKYNMYEADDFPPYALDKISSVGITKGGGFFGI